MTSSYKNLFKNAKQCEESCYKGRGKLPGIISKRFREKHLCQICLEIESTFKPKCWDEDDLGDVAYACKECHDMFCCFCREKPFRKEFGQ